MCGLVGFIDRRQAMPADARAELIRRMTETIRHRGPDDEGRWQDPEHGVVLGFRRLSIIDLSQLGHQPMFSPSGRYTIIFNGEIYNHRDIRNELDQLSTKIHWRGRSDTEVMLAAIDHWGVEGALRKFNGMFAFALWDRQSQILTLARDRFGEKPMYYGWANGTFLFGSELKALKVHPHWAQIVDRNALAAFLRYSYIPSPASIYCGIHKLPAATYFQLGVQDAIGSLPLPTAYWSAKEAAAAGIANTTQAKGPELIDELERHLRESVSSRMESDVPLGAFLSGGIDSSTVVAMMQASSSRPVKTFSIGFWEEDFNEAHHAAAVAKNLGTEHTELYVTALQAQAVITKLPSIYDEPFGDASQIPTFLVSELARQHVVVALTGDAGDENFLGYARYFSTINAWRGISAVPLSLRSKLASAATAIPPQSWDRLNSLLPKRARVQRLGDRLHKLAAISSENSADALYVQMLTFCQNAEDYVLDSAKSTDYPSLMRDFRVDMSLADRMMLLDQLTYLSDDILVKVDRASMAVSLETRVPMLDHRLVEFAWQIPNRLKSLDGRGKWPLRQVLARYLPLGLIDRPKMGFGVPIIDWLRGPLRDWAEELLNPARLAADGFFSPTLVRSIWAKTISGQQNYTYLLWNILMFQAWLEHEQPAAVTIKAA